MTNIRFTLVKHPDNVPRITLEIPEGASVKDVTLMCTGTEGVTIPEDELYYKVGWLVDGGEINRRYVFDGTERNIDILDMMMPLGC